MVALGAPGMQSQVDNQADTAQHQHPEGGCQELLLSLHHIRPEVLP